MTETKKFDLLTSPLENTNLIEASAGTGKTYTIAGLFIRLIVEKRFAVDEILVVTFTEAATEELRGRIRSSLRKTVEAFSTKQTEDKFIAALIKKYSSIAGAAQLLKDAIRDFDQAAIFTIHGFCKRMLDENAFESGSLFDTELVTEQDSIKKEIVQDFWRKNIYHASSLFVNFLLKKRVSPDSLLSLIGIRIIQPDFNVIPQVEIPDTTQQVGRESGDSVTKKEEWGFLQAFKQLSKAWQPAKRDVENILLNNENLSRNKYRRESIPTWISLMDDLAASNGSNPVLFDKFEKFTAMEITNATKKNCPIPNHPFFEICEKLKTEQEKLLEVFEQHLLGLKVALFNYVRAELIKRKKEKNIQSFDDLLLNVYHALQAAGGNDLADSIRKKFKAALIDEFQDTDPVQYEIFKNIFSHPHQILFLIGDPKQAIYGFRGADIFAYMEAARHSTSRYTLNQNWRSEPRLITAINNIFANAKSPFIYDEIPYELVAAAEKEDRNYLTINNKQESPLQLWYMDAAKFAEKGKLISKTSAREIIYKTVAAEISRLLRLSKQNNAVIGEQPIKEQHFAVLVRRNSEAMMMQKALAELNIPGVLYSTSNLFECYEAMEVQRVLAGIAEPNNEKLLKVALTTDMLGKTAEDIDSLMENEAEWETWLIKFRKYYDTWSRRGFIQMFRMFISDEGVLPRLMSFQNGERRNTNVLHLAEVLHQVSVDKKLGMTELLKWLSDQRDSRTPRLEEHQLRLESDENAVKLVTIHKSKGLEYPIVFCPFTWDGSKIKNTADYIAFHDENNNLKLTLDLGSEHKEENRILAEKELLAENLRLMYVGLTRAKHRCYLVWGRFNEAETSAPAYLFHQPQQSTAESLFQGTSSRFKAMNDKEALAELESVVNKSKGTIRLSQLEIEDGEKYLPEYGKSKDLTFRPFSGSIDSGWRISSYSSLVSRISHAAELADYDYELALEEPVSIVSEEAKTEQVPPGILSFPKGAKAGIFFHKIFELIDFEQPDIEIIDNNLTEYGFDPQWLEDITRMIDNVLSIPLDPEYENFTLSKINNQSRLNELEFYFPLKTISPAKLTNLINKYAEAELSDHFPQRIESLNFLPMSGYMKGFIDLVFQYDNRFYIVDWKSNFLGDRIKDYEQSKIKATMEKEFYILQYHIYTVALNQYLRLRMPDYDYEKHFGGVCYIFLRGVDPLLGYEYGIFRDRPTNEFVDELSEKLILSNG